MVKKIRGKIYVIFGKFWYINYFLLMIGKQLLVRFFKDSQGNILQRSVTSYNVAHNVLQRTT